MANPLKNEQEIYDTIRKEHISVHPLVWELIDHHVRNDLNIVNLIIGTTILDGQELSEANARKVVGHVKNVGSFLSNLKKETSG